MNSSSPRVLVVQRRLTHYRVAFFEAARELLRQRGVELVLACGEGTAAESRKEDAGVLDWATRLPTRYWLNGRVCIQPFEHVAKGCDATVITPENKLLLNLLEQYFVKSRKVCLWGHGANLQGDPRSLREWFKRKVARHADWWFGYTDLSVPLIERSGFPVDRITVLDNTVDTVEMASMRAQVDEVRIERLRAELGIMGSHVGIYVGSLYAEKRIDMLLDAALAIRKRVPGFELLIVGGGPLADVVARFCSDHPWAKCLGVRKGQDKVDLLALGRALLNPGAVGLGMLDAFVCRVPMITTDCGLHGPEIAYLNNAGNGVMTANDPAAYVEAVCRVLTDDALHVRLVSGCDASASRYSLDNMVSRFADGIERCLAAPRHRGGGR